MKPWKFWGFVLLVGTIGAWLLYILLGEAARLALLNTLKTMLFWVWGIVVLCFVLAIPWVLGWFARSFAVERIDEIIDPNQWLEGWQHAILGIVSALIIGLFQLLIATKAPEISGWVHSTYRIVGWSGAWEVTPYGWILYGLLTSGIGYWFSNDSG